MLTGRLIAQAPSSRGHFFIKKRTTWMCGLKLRQFWKEDTLEYAYN